MNYLRMIAVLITLLTTKSTVYSQNISQDSLKCFTYSQAKIIFKDLKRGEICDSISQLQALQLINFKDIVGNKEEEISLLNSKISDQKKSLNTSNLKLKVSKKISKFGIPSALIGGFILGIYINN